MNLLPLVDTARARRGHRFAPKVNRRDRAVLAPRRRPSRGFPRPPLPLGGANLYPRSLAMGAHTELEIAHKTHPRPLAMWAHRPRQMANNTPSIQQIRRLFGHVRWGHGRARYVRWGEHGQRHSSRIFRPVGTCCTTRSFAPRTSTRGRGGARLATFGQLRKKVVVSTPQPRHDTRPTPPVGGTHHIPGKRARCD